MVLPVVLHKKNAFFMMLVAAAVFGLCYLIPNHFHWITPDLLPLTEYDRLVPFIPNSVYVYNSEYFLFIGAFFLFRDRSNQNRFFWAFVLMNVFCFFIFTFFPTTYPRSDYPIPADVHWFTQSVFHGLRTIDDPSNTFPSLHVGCCVLTTLAFLPKKEFGWKFWVSLVWSIAVSLSTLTTKQHYIVDILGGTIVASAAYYVFYKKTEYVSVQEFKNRWQKVLKRSGLSEYFE